MPNVSQNVCHTRGSPENVGIASFSRRTAAVELTKDEKAEFVDKTGTCGGVRW